MIGEFYAWLIAVICCCAAAGVYDLLWNRPSPLEHDDQPDRRGDDVE